MCRAATGPLPLSVSALKALMAGEGWGEGCALERMDPPAAADAAELSSSADTPSKDPSVIVEPATCTGGAATAAGAAARRVPAGEIGAAMAVAVALVAVVMESSGV